MRKALIQIGLPLIVLGVIRLFIPQLLFKFAGLGSTFAILGVATAVTVLIITATIGKRLDFRPLFAVASIACLALLIIIFNAPTLWGLRATYVSVMDMFVVFESALLLALSALQPKTEEALSIFTAIAVWSQLLASKFKARRAGNGPAFTPGLNVPHYNS